MKCCCLSDNMTSTTLSYANGPGYFTDKNEDLSRKNLTGISIGNKFSPRCFYLYPSVIIGY